MSTETIEGIPLTDSIDGGDMSKKLRLQAQCLSSMRKKWEDKNKEKIHYEKGKHPRTYVMRMVGSSRGPVFRPNSDNPGRRPFSAKPVERVQKDGAITLYASMSEAATETGMSAAHISACLNGHIVRTKDGSTWRMAK